MKKILILFLSLIVLGGCSSKKDVKIKIGYLGISASLPLFVIQENKMFEDEGILYESIPFQTSNQLVDALAANQIDFIVECSAVPVLARESKSPGKIIIFAYSDISIERPFDAIVAIDKSINSIQNLAGKNIGVFPGSTSQRLLDYFLKSKEINTNSITYTPIIPPNMLPSLKSGFIDALHTYEPTTTIALMETGAHEVFGTVYGNMMQSNPQGVACISRNFLTEHQDLANEVIKIFNKSFEFIEQNEIKAKSYLTKYISLNENIAKQTKLLYFIPSTIFNEKHYYEYANILLSIGEIDSVVKYEEVSLVN